MSEQEQFSQQANTAFIKKEAVRMVLMMVLFTGTMMTSKTTRIVEVGHFQMVSTTRIQKSSFVVGLMETKTSL